MKSPFAEDGRSLLGRASKVFGKISPGIRQKIVRGGGGSLLLKGTSILLSLAVVVVLARLMGPAGYGVYSFVFALASLIAVPSQFGLPALVVRETARAAALGEWSVVKGIWKWASMVSGGLALGLSCVALIVLFFFRSRFSGAEVSTALVALALVPLIALGNLRGAALRGLRKVVIGQLPEFIIRPTVLTLGALMLVAVAGTDALTPPVAMIIHLGAALVSFLIGAMLLIRHQPAEVRRTSEREFRHRAWLSATGPLALLAGMQVLNQHIGVLCLGLLGPPEDVGIYRVAVQASLMITAGLQAVVMVAAPYFARVAALQDNRKHRLLTLLCIAASVGIGTPVFLVYLIWGDVLLSALLGADFARGYLPLALISFGQLIVCASSVVSWSLNMAGNERTTAKALAIGALSNVALNVVLCPILGLMGAAWAALIGAAITGLAMALAGRRIIWTTKAVAPQGGPN